MYKLCKTEQSARRQRELEQGLLEAMLQMPYEEISVSDLCDSLGVPRKSFYRYFSGKDGALYALLDHTMMEFFDSETAGGGSAAQVVDLGLFFLFWRQHEKLLRALQANGLSGILVERAMALTMRERLMPGYMQEMPQQIQQLALSFSVCGLISMVIQWYNQGFEISPEEMKKIALSILTKPLIE